MKFHPGKIAFGVGLILAWWSIPKLFAGHVIRKAGQDYAQAIERIRKDKPNG